MSWWKHEWLHAEIGPFHMENNECALRHGYNHKFENAWMRNYD